jgi:hypothetical protein
MDEGRSYRQEHLLGPLSLSGTSVNSTLSRKKGAGFPTPSTGLTYAATVRKIADSFQVETCRETTNPIKLVVPDF